MESLKVIVPNFSLNLLLVKMSKKSLTRANFRSKKNICSATVHVYDVLATKKSCDCTLGLSASYFHKGPICQNGEIEIYTSKTLKKSCF